MKTTTIHPREVTVEIESRIGGSHASGSQISGSHRGLRIRSRQGERLRVAVTYRLEESEGAPIAEVELTETRSVETELAPVIRRCVRLTRRAYRLARTPREQGGRMDQQVRTSRPVTIPPDLVRVVVMPEAAMPKAAVIAETAPMPEAAVMPEVVENPLATESKEGEIASQRTGPDKFFQADEERELDDSELATSNPIIEPEEPLPRKATQTQLSALEIMARQLGLQGEGLTQLLGLRCNRKRLKDLTHREAAALIAHFSRMLRQRLQKERDDKADATKSGLARGRASEGSTLAETTATGSESKAKRIKI